VEVEAGWGIWVEGSAGELRVRVGEATGAPKVLGEESSRVGVGFGGGQFESVAVVGRKSEPLCLQ
jgi:hypothetical protein